MQKKLFGSKERRLLLFLILFYSIYFFIRVAINVYAWAAVEYIKPPVSIINAIKIYLAEYVSTIIIAAFIVMFTNKQFVKKKDWVKVALTNLILSVFLTFLIITIYNFGQHSWFVGRKFDGLLDYINNVLINFPFFFLLILCFNFFTVAYYYLEQVKNVQIERKILEKELTFSKLQVLNSQVQPHFLFNSINSIVSLMDEDVRRAQESLIDLSDFFRNVLAVGDQQKVKLSRELQILEKYIEMMKTRFNDKMVYITDIDEVCFDYYVPSLLLQPIVENALKYGYDREHKILEILISANSVNDFLLLEIHNNGRPIDNMETIFNRGTGLSNLKNRLEHLYGNDYRLLVENMELDKGVKFSFEIPLKTN